MRREILLTTAGVSAWWLLSGLVGVAQTVTMVEATGHPLSWQFVLRTELSSDLLWIPFTLALFACVRRVPFERGHVLRATGLLGLAVAGVVLVRAFLVFCLNPMIGWYPNGTPPFERVLLASVFNNLLMCWMIVGVAHALIYAERESRRRRQTAELEARLTEARLQALSAQLNPHFLFNALNSIAELVHRDADAADRMLVGLGGLLRYSLDGAHAQEVALRDELESLSNYVEIEKVRLGTRLRFECSIAPEALRARVPRLVLQPLVENAIRYAIAPRQAPGCVRVSARRRDERLVVEVVDDGDGGDRDSSARAATSGHGIGLDNTRDRLRVLYGADHRFEVRRGDDGGVSARLEMPFRPIAEAA